MMPCPYCGSSDARSIGRHRSPLTAHIPSPDAIADALSQARAEGRREGAEEMREQAAKIADGHATKADFMTGYYGAHAAHSIAEQIRALATPAGKEG